MEKAIVFISLFSLSISSTNMLGMICPCLKKKRDRTGYTVINCDSSDQNDEPARETWIEEEQYTQDLPEDIEIVSPLEIERAKKQDKCFCLSGVICACGTSLVVFGTLITFGVLRVTGALDNL